MPGALELDDAIIAHALDLLRVDAGTRERILAILYRLESDLVAKLANEPELTAFGKGRTEALLKEIAAVIDNYFAMAQGELALTLQGAAPVTALHTAGAITATIKIGAGLPTPTYLARLASNALMQGAVTSDWWTRLAEDTAFKVATALRQGLAAGESNQTIIARIAGKRGVVGVLDISRRHAAALVQTSAQVVANAARLETYAKNPRAVKALRWLTALDGHVCVLCAARAEKTWTNETDPQPIGHSIPFLNPPIHWNDRCLLLPVMATFKELGLDIPEPQHVARASTGGPVPASTTLEQWLSRRSVAQQNEQLGVGRAALWRQGIITMEQMLDLSGNQLTLAQLVEKYGQAA